MKKTSLHHERRLALTAFAAAALAFAAAPAGATIIGIDFAGNVVTIDETNGVGAALGASGFDRTNSMAADSLGTIYTANNDGALGTGQLITINPANGAGAGGATFTTSNGARGLAFSAGNVLFAILDTGPDGALGPDSLYTIDVATGARALVGATGLRDVQGLAFSPGGTLYGWDIDIGLVTLSLATGAATDVNALVGAPVEIQALDFAPDGTLYGARDELYTIDPATGIAALVGSGGYLDLRGIAFAAAADVPAPASLGLLALGAVAIAARRRRG